MPIRRVQRELLERGLRRDGLIVPPPRSGREVRAARRLLRRGLLLETRTVPGQIELRRDSEGLFWALIISDAGRKAIGWTCQPARERARSRNDAR
jgi:hypothetical protein